MDNLMNESNSPIRKLLDSPFGSVLKERNIILGIILLSALIGFEMFNFSTTEYALGDLLGGMRFAGIRWSTILSIAFCGIDFAGIARLFTGDDQDSNEKEIWFLFVAWLMAATLNATLTWWGVSLALTNHSMMSTEVIDSSVLTRIVPVFVSIIVWVTRILLISSITSAGSRMLARPDEEQTRSRPKPVTSSDERPHQPIPGYTNTNPRPGTRSVRANSNAYAARATTPAPPPPQRPNNTTRNNIKTSAPINLDEERPEPEYIPDPSYSPSPAFHSISAKSSNSNNSSQRR
jgi:hypothetical protein